MMFVLCRWCISIDVFSSDFHSDELYHNCHYLWGIFLIRFFEFWFLSPYFFRSLMIASKNGDMKGCFVVAYILFWAPKLTQCNHLAWLYMKASISWSCITSGLSFSILFFAGGRVHRRVTSSQDCSKFLWQL